MCATQAVTALLTSICVRTAEEKRSSEDRARADLQCQQLQQQVHQLQQQVQAGQGQVAEAHRLRLEARVAADTAIDNASQRLEAFELRLRQHVSTAEQATELGLLALKECTVW